MQAGNDRSDGTSTRAGSPTDDGRQAPTIIVSPGGRHTVLWLIAVLLAVIATVLVLRLDDARLMHSAMAQTETPGGAMVGARGIYAFSGQMTAKSFGLFMLDVDTGTVWCYELSRAANDELLLRLVAARSWTSDRYLEEFNVADPVPAAVRMMVQQQRSMRQNQADLPPATAPAKGPILPEEGGAKK
jgi:hypothetical protein